MIITKSISRFARNTVTLLETVRELKLLGIDVFFEEQNIHTISADGELMMTILASYAQAESLSASENQKWRIRKAFENGEIVNLRFLFGYRINGTKIEIDLAQADIVREVFERAINGESFTSIAKDLNNTCCKTPHITEDEIKERFLKVYNGLISDKEPFIKACKLTRDVLTDAKVIDKEMTELLRELEVVTELIKKCIAENSSSAQDQEKYTERYNNYVDRYEKAKSRYDEIEHQKKNKLSKRKALDRFISDLSKRDELLTEFDNCLWLTVVDAVTVRNDGTLVFKFNDGTEIDG